MLPYMKRHEPWRPQPKDPWKERVTQRPWNCPEDRLKRRLPFLRAGAESLGSPRWKVPQWGLNPRL